MKLIQYILLILISCCSCNEKVSERTEIGNDGIVEFKHGSSKYAYKYEKAAELLNIGKLDDAEEIYVELKRIDSKNMESIHIGLGSVNLMRKDYTNAINNYAKAISFNNKSYGANLGLASVYYSQKDFSKALSHYRIAKTISPELPDAYWGLSMTFEYLKKSDSSEYYSKKFLQLAPKSKYNKIFREKNKDRTLPNED